MTAESGARTARLQVGDELVGLALGEAEHHARVDAQNRLQLTVDKDRVVGCLGGQRHCATGSGPRDCGDRGALADRGDEIVDLETGEITPVEAEPVAAGTGNGSGRGRKEPAAAPAG